MVQRFFKSLTICLLACFVLQFTYGCSSDNNQQMQQYPQYQRQYNPNQPAPRDGYYYNQQPTYYNNGYPYQQQPGSRYYSNPYAFPPQNTYPYYDGDQYYVPPTYYGSSNRDNNAPTIQKY